VTGCFFVMQIPPSFTTRRLPFPASNCLNGRNPSPVTSPLYHKIFKTGHFVHRLQFEIVGVCVVLIDIPYDITAVKFVHWTWHDTDPNIYDRHYWVPWNSFYFHATFAASFTFWFHCWRRLLISKYSSDEEKWTAGESVNTTATAYIIDR
jgi:hypothetical protein